MAHYITNWPYVRSQTFSVQSNWFLRLKCIKSRVWATETRLLVPLNNGPPTKRSRPVLICRERMCLFFCKSISSNRQIVFLSFLEVWWLYIARCAFFSPRRSSFGGWRQLRTRKSILLALSVTNQLTENCLALACSEKGYDSDHISRWLSEIATNYGFVWRLDTCSMCMLYVIISHLRWSTNGKRKTV